MLEDHVDHQSDGFSCPVNAVVSSPVDLVLEDPVKIHHIKPEGSRGVSDLNISNNEEIMVS